MPFLEKMCNSSFRGRFGEERNVQKLKRAVGGGAEGRANTGEHTGEWAAVGN